MRGMSGIFEIMDETFVVRKRILHLQFFENKSYGGHLAGAAQSRHIDIETPDWLLRVRSPSL